MSIYRSQLSKSLVINLYNAQIAKLDIPYQDIFVETSFGRTHVVEIGNPEGKPLLVFHGGNSTTAYNLLESRFLLEKFHVYAVDIIGHPGKSAENILMPFGYHYGRWAGEVISALGYEKICCLGSSFGGGVLTKLMCIAPSKVERAVLLVPAGINNAFPADTAKMIVPLAKYYLTKDEKYMKETAMYMALSEKALKKDFMAVIKNTLDNVKIHPFMPSNVEMARLHKCKAPALVMAAEYDCLFPARKVLPKAKKVLPNCKIHMLKGRGHIPVLRKREKQIIVDFLM
ncbi:MAG: alpha/beta hydrolase [Lachnospiraceae bacterium]|jgi:pimeloyl-ACP methyl ester carboxylesterase|nr:alpha/beta hydrolase [Lachnospiraceae bacterium]